MATQEHQHDGESGSHDHPPATSPPEAPRPTMSALLASCAAARAVSTPPTYESRPRANPAETPVPEAHGPTA